MKTGSISSGNMLFRQARTTQDSKETSRKEPKKTAGEQTDRTTQKSSLVSTVITSSEEALELIRGIDFRQFRDVEWMSKSGTTKLAELLQS
jgi:hypothetical protein